MTNIYKRNLAAAAAVVASPCVLGGFVFSNGSATACYVQIFDKALATDVTIGTTVPNMVVRVGNASTVVWSGAVGGVEFQNGIVAAATTEDDNGTGSTWGTDATTGDFNFFVY